MRLTQAAIVAILAFTVAATPIQARQDVQTTDLKPAPDHYLPKCFDKYGKEVTCGMEHEQQPDKGMFATTAELLRRMPLTSPQSLRALLRRRNPSIVGHRLPAIVLPVDARCRTRQSKTGRS